MEIGGEGRIEALGPFPQSLVQIGSQIGKRIPWIFSLFGGNSFADPQETESISNDPQETVDNPNRLAQSAPKSDQKRLDRTGLSISSWNMYMLHKMISIANVTLTCYIRYNMGVIYVLLTYRS